MFIITDKTKVVVEESKGVGVMKDKEIKLEEIESSDTLGGNCTNLDFVQFQKPKLRDLHDSLQVRLFF